MTPATMHSASPRPFPIILAAVFLFGGSAVAWQWRESVALRVDLEGARSAATEFARLREQNRQWRARQIPDSELERLRADHAALPRLRAELQTLERASSPGP